MIKGRIAPYVFLAPFLLLFLLFFIFPFFYALYLSLFVTRMGQPLYVGLLNYVHLFQDSAYWASLVTVFRFSLVQVLILLTVSMAIALFLDTPYVKSKGLFRLVYFLPYAVPGVIAAVIWGFLYSPELNPALHWLGINPLSGKGLFWAIVNMTIWQLTGYNMTLLFANLTSIPVDIYEAAHLDGCSEARLAWSIKLPLLRPTIILITVLSIIGTLQLFNQPFILMSLTTVPANFTPNLDIYTTAFSYGNFNYSAAMAVVLALITVLASFLFIYGTSANRRSERHPRG
ncbi:lactose transport system permease protein LacF [Peptococcaceae bacterium CEB3]|nr:lactose transport system permease protein LacF [Peptococcaceae bacterium CEB3]